MGVDGGAVMQGGPLWVSPAGYWGPHGVKPFSPHPPPSPGILETDITFLLILMLILTLSMRELLGGNLSFEGA